ncbi:WD40 repeat domain-containing protein, partial [Scytonema sp. PCC 10023]|uniref:WD40 repeat domain-containing protein n=1 Tax=Scytonema sp. PCC 10023 TaxID=1680591 RepID=UPI0039C6F0CC
AFSPDGKTIASGSVDNTVRLWNLNGQLLKTLSGHGSSVRSVAFSPDGKTIASGNNDNTVRLWNLNGQLLKTLSGHS